MKDTVLDPGACGSMEEIPRICPAGDAAEDTGPAASIAATVLEQVDRQLQTFQRGIVETVAGTIAERLDSLVELKVRKSLTGSLMASTDRMKDAVLKVMQGVLLESGLLERFIVRAVEAKLQEAQGPGSGAVRKEELERLVKEQCAPALEASRKELLDLVVKEVAQAMSSEGMKVMLDEKFRAISLYLKTDVVPKAVAHALKSSKVPA
ncbi:MAG: hypothetical protein HY721_00185 [Planctomycetes bacterium]|nr:hypothetical protein [Planctomycetota bacterium]